MNALHYMQIGHYANKYKYYNLFFMFMHIDVDKSVYMRG
jgi:hypothetical protein